MDVRITPLSSLVPLPKSSSNISSSKNNNRFITLNTSNQETSKQDTSRQDTSRQNLLLQDRTRFNKSHYFIPAKSLSSNNSNSLLLLAKKNANKPLYSMKITSKEMQPSNDIYASSNFSTSAANKKQILLYQQVERDKLFSNRTELVNRFNHKV